MRRFETYAREKVSGVEPDDLPSLLETLTEQELVRLLGGMPSATDPERLRKNIVTTELENRVVRLHRLLVESAPTQGQRDLGEFTQSLARVLRLEGACVDEVVGESFRLHGQYGLPPRIMETEQCRTSSMAMCDHVLKTGQTLHVPNIPADPRWSEAAAYTTHGLRHYTGAPGYSPDGVLRCVIWVTDHKARALTEHDVQLVERFAERLALEFATPALRGKIVRAGVTG